MESFLFTSLTQKYEKKITKIDIRPIFEKGVVDSKNTKFLPVACILMEYFLVSSITQNYNKKNNKSTALATFYGWGSMHSIN